MRLEVSGHQIEITPALNDFATTKLERIARHFDHHLELRLLLAVDRLQHRAEATLSPRGKQLHAEAEAADMYSAIDLLVDKLDRMLIKEKERFTDHHRGESAARSGHFG
ncbi:MAG: ribosome-associated translation inhibitor RaiA [Xanthomonadaceae bacterium]|jgi:putative sigma-54 modulation protein|nr:ribosome-associated translation inhibitor RaiA [Xanthomonadaceae bacterium]